ncbi:MAG: hypothetical protein NTW47_10410 [Proteobacteria bacterium]|nr:hypothetical protein [Pseudomonadota bacterium]
MSRWLTLAVLCLAAASARADDIFMVAPALWDRPRSARAVLEQPAVRQALEQYLARPAARLIIHHGYGLDPLLQAEELRMWLMALAVDGARVALINDVRPHEPLKIEVVK